MTRDASTLKHVPEPSTTTQSRRCAARVAPSLRRGLGGPREALLTTSSTAVGACLAVAACPRVAPNDAQSRDGAQLLNCFQLRAGGRIKGAAGPRAPSHARPGEHRSAILRLLFLEGLGRVAMGRGLRLAACHRGVVGEGGRARSYVRRRHGVAFAPIPGPPQQRLKGGQTEHGAPCQPCGDLLSAHACMCRLCLHED